MKNEKLVTITLVAIVIGWTLAVCTGCAGFKVGVYGERVDTVKTEYITSAPKTGMADAVYEWLFVNHEKKA